MDKYKVVIWDIDRIGLDWLDRNTDTSKYEIVDIVLNGEDTEGIPVEDLVKYLDCWDLLMVFTRRFYSMAIEILNKCGIPKDKVLFPLDAFSLYDHMEFSKSVFTNNVERRLAWAVQKKYNDYVTCSVDGLSYLAPSSDNAIIANMYITNENWAKEDIHRFYDLAERFFSFSAQQTLFCDIGSNIGTTSIYFKKKIDPDVKIFAMEPVEENIKLLRINMMLNGIDPEQEIILPYAVGEKDEESVIYISPDNCGANSIVSHNSNEAQSIMIRSLDSVFGELGIDPIGIKYLWVDVEGYEMQFVQGAINTLKSISAPVVLEFIPNLIRETCGLETYINTLKSVFNGYIILQESGENIHPIDELISFENSDEGMDLFLLK